jgi:hypothetical protein
LLGRDRRRAPVLASYSQTTRLWKWDANITIASSCDNNDAVTGEKQMQPFISMNGIGEGVRAEYPVHTGGHSRRRVYVSVAPTPDIPDKCSLC